MSASVILMYGSTYDFLFKIVILGNGTVGKTSLVKKFCEGKFDVDYKMTIGADFMTKELEVYHKKVKLQLWDFAGQQRFRNLVPQFMRGSMGAIYVVDLSDIRTLYGSGLSEEDYKKNPNAPEGIYPWELDVYNNVTINLKEGEAFKTLLIGNKKDVADQLARAFDKGEDILKDKETILKDIGPKQWAWVDYQVSNKLDYRIKEEELKKYAKERGWACVVTSAKTGEKVNESFTYIAQELVYYKLPSASRSQLFRPMI